MWTSNDSKAPEGAQGSASPVVEMPATATRAAHQPTLSQHSTIGKSIKIKGEITATDPVYIYGTVEGLISAPAHRVTVGKEGIVKADVSAREVVIMGSVNGNLNSGDRVEIRSDGSLTGDLATRRICIEEGAVVTGRIDIRKPSKKETGEALDEADLTLATPEAESAEDTDAERENWADLAVSEIA
jgi:cytoskeletal protein CcmA (bactofilin family)